MLRMRKTLHLLVLAAVLATVLAQEFQYPKPNDLGWFDVPKAAFLKLTDLWEENAFSLLVSQFKPFGTDSVSVVRDIASQEHQVDVLTTDVTWPNEVAAVPSDVFSGPNKYIVVSGGFLVPGKGNGHVSIVDVTDPSNTKTYHVSPTKKGWFYHRSIFLDMNKDGRLDILTARAHKGTFGGSGGELLWLEHPENSDLATPWKEHVIMEGGPDVFFEVDDIDGDGNSEIVATEFFVKEPQFAVLWVEGNHWGDEEAQVKSKSIATGLGPMFAVNKADLNRDGKPDYVVTNHVNNEDQSGIFAFETPSNFKTEEWPMHTLKQGIKTLKGGIGQASPGAALPFFPTNSMADDGHTKPLIVVAGDGAEAAFLLTPKYQDQSDWSYNFTTLIQTGGVVGAIATGDVDGDGSTEIYVPDYDHGKVYAYTYGSSMKPFDASLQELEASDILERLCEAAVAEMEAKVEEKVHLETLQTAIYELCDQLPIYGEKCKKVANDYMDTIVHLLEAKASPDTVCHAIIKLLP